MAAVHAPLARVRDSDDRPDLAKPDAFCLMNRPPGRRHNTDMKEVMAVFNAAAPHVPCQITDALSTVTEPSRSFNKPAIIWAVNGAGCVSVN